MALHADLERPFRRKPGRIDDLRASARLNVLAAGTVAALAINACRQRRAENEFGSRMVVALRNLGIRIMAEHAVVADLPSGGRPCGIEARIKLPSGRPVRHTMRAALRSAHRARSGEDKSGRDFRTHYVIDAQFLDVVGLTVEPGLPAPLVNAVAAPDEAEKGIRSAVLPGLAYRCWEPLGGGATE